MLRTDKVKAKRKTKADIRQASQAIGHALRNQVSLNEPVMALQNCVKLRVASAVKDSSIPESSHSPDGRFLWRDRFGELGLHKHQMNVELFGLEFHSSDMPLTSDCRAATWPIPITSARSCDAIRTWSWK
jgi:hypothetical protein